MKIAVSTQGQDLDAVLEPRFGRAAGFIIYDTEDEDFQYLSNAASVYASQGAGIQTAQKVARSGAEAVITGHVGPKAFAALQAGDISVYLCQARRVRDALQEFSQGRLEATAGADKGGHWQ